VSDLTRAVHLAYEIVSEDLDIHSWQSGYFLMQSRSPRAPQMLTPLPGDEVLKARMVTDGWCPSDVYRISSQASIPSTLYFVSMFDKPRPLLRHENCTSMYCKHWKVDEGSYVTNHVSDGCDCQSVATPLGDIEEILSSGSDLIPLITPDITNVGADGQKYVKLERSSPERRYVAISHVWSDGRGNPTANEIPLCQFRRLSAIVKQAWGDSQVFFWFDTLCFPYPASADKAGVQTSHGKDAYYLRESRPRLGSRLLPSRQGSRRHDRARDPSTHIVFGVEYCRLWTFQEYRLAKRTMFQFKSGTVEMPFALLDKPVWTTDYIFENIKSMRIVTPKSLVPFLEKLARMNITTLQKELCFRATSVAEDEALCLANLLGLDSEQIVNARPADRMKIIWQNVDPHSAFEALFWPCQRMDQDGLRWAPKSLMFRCLGAVSVLPAGHTEGSVEDGKFVPRGPSRLVKVSPRGISFQCGGVMLSGFSQRPPGPTFKFEEGKRCYSVHAVYDDQGRVVPSDAEQLPMPSKPLFPFRGMLVLLSPYLFDDRSLDTQNMSVAILCSLKQPASPNEPRQTAQEHGWQHHGLYEVQLWCVVIVRRFHSGGTLENVISAQSDGEYRNWRFRERIETINGRKTVVGSWGRYVCEGEDTQRIKSEMDRTATPKMLPPQGLLIGERAVGNITYVMR
jgi:hypothetical protein